jgi:hypothetical protein
MTDSDIQESDRAGRAHGASQPQRVDAFDKFKRLERSDTPQQMPAWRDPRPQLPAGRWRNPRGAA